MGDSLHVRTLTGAAIGPWLDDLARLRIAVFAEFPYLYAGDVGYERRYLETYTRSPESLFVLALDDGQVVGASTGLPLADETDEFRAPFRARGIDPAPVFYFGEPVLLPAWRGRSLGHRFFDEREGHARRLGRFDATAFCAVDRAADDPRRPAGHLDNDAFWRKRGYARRQDLQATLSWAEHGESAETPKTLTFWTRPLEQTR